MLHKILNVKYPILQAPMAGGILNADVVSRVSEYGMLGSIASGYLNIKQIEEFIIAVKDKTNKPFSLNLFVDYMPYINEPISKPSSVIFSEREKYNIDVPFFCVPPQPSMDDLVRLAVDLAVPIVSTTFGLLSDAHISILKTSGIKIMTTVNSVYELRLALNTQHPDVLIYQNRFAGGHKGGFTSLPHSNEREILEVTSGSDVPCVLAGAIVSKNDIANALENGFSGVQIGTAFLATQESSAGESYKNAILTRSETIFTTKITGKMARGLKNSLAVLDVDDVLGFPYMHYATIGLRKAAKAQNDIEYQSLWCGDGASKITTIPSLDTFMNSLI